jgi:eukaryotic-like serine/threonine-protein kinase
MESSRADRVAEIVETALETTAEQRARLIADLCGQDADLRCEVESLLGFQEKVSDFIEQPAYLFAPGMPTELDGELKTGERLGQYEIISLIGEGGMGEVYLAQDTSLGRKVAIKLLKLGLGTANIIRHFHQEESILAGLIHPNIAQLYGGALTANGLPFFVMEYVEGTRLDDYCRQNQLTIPERLELFRKICLAVSYAHQHLIIHRDIKPANIRVTADGEPKLLDFGIAKLMDPSTAAAHEATMTFAAVMTPEYASPEQVRGEAMTTASDVYSLGVILYELLAAQKPYKLETRSPAVVVRAITEQEPTRPSAAAAKGENSKLEIRNSKLLKGDLDNIVLKALRKEPARRYASVAELLDDIRRYLEGRPVTARRDTLGYRTLKFMGRNRIAVAAAILVLLAVVSGLLIALWQAQNARRQRDVTERINTFLQDMLGAAAPEAKGSDVKVVDVLNEASHRARTELKNQPDVMANVLMTLGRTYISLGQYQPAVSNLRAALDASLETSGQLNATSANIMSWLGLALANDDQATQGEAISRKAVALQRKLHPEGNANLGVALYGLGLNLLLKGDAKSAQHDFEEAADLIGKFLGRNHGYYLATLTASGLAHEEAGDFTEAERFYRRAIAIGRNVEPRYRIFLAQATSYFGLLLTRQKQYDEAEKMLRQSESIYRQVMGGANSSVPSVQADLGWLYFLKGNYAKAEVEYREALQLLPRFFPPEHSSILGTKMNFALTLTRLGKATEAEPYLREVLGIRKKSLLPDHYLIALTESALGECLTAQKRYKEAEPLLTHSYSNLKVKFGAGDRRVISARARLVTLYESWGKPDQAVQFRSDQ